MRLLMVNYEFPPIGGGAGQAHQRLLQQFAGEKGLQVDVLTSGTETGLHEQSLGGQVRLLRVGLSKRRLHVWTRREVVTWLWKARGPYRRLLRDGHYDLVHAFFGFPSGWLCYRSRRQAPYVISLRGSDVPGDNARLQLDYVLLGSTVFKPIWRSARAVVACSEGLRRRARRFAPEVAVEVIPNGVDTEVFFPAAGHGRGGPVRLLTVGRLSVTKRVDRLIAMVARLRGQSRDVTLTIAGDGALRDALTHQVERLGLGAAVHLLGRIDAGAMAELYRQHDLYVSASMQEGMSNAFLEAMASGLPIVTTACEGVEELIGDNGRIVESDRPEDLAAAVAALLDDDEERREMARSARRRAERMTWADVARQYLGLYRKLLA